jgi:spore coat polysaccharide biosynthesis protein SpsF (cytidylyltransferase family)
MVEQETLEEFIEREGYTKGITQEIWEDGVILGAKWQAERMYSEEEVYNLLCSMPNFYNMTILQQVKARDKWFEQFKKQKDG